MASSSNAALPNPSADTTTVDGYASLYAWLAQKRWTDIIDMLQQEQERGISWEHIFSLKREDWRKIGGLLRGPAIHDQLHPVATPSNKRSYKTFISPFDEGRDGLCLISDERQAWFDGLMTQNPVCLLRSPPRSGKTTLAAILEEYFQNKGHRVVSISMLDIETYRGEKDLESFDHYWTERAGMSWTQCVNCNEPTDVLIDEAQILYKSATFFWAKIKSLMQSKTRNRYLRVLLLSMYGDSGAGAANGPTATPIHFEFALGLDGLRLWRTEYEMLIDNFIALSIANGLTITIPNTVRNAIFNATLGHPGIIRRVLALFRNEYRRTFKDIPVMQRISAMLRFLVSPGFRDALQESHALSWIKNRQFNQDEIRFLRKALYEMDLQSTFPVDMNNGTVAQIIRDFKHSGLVTQTDNAVGGRLQFAAPLVRIMLGQRLFTAPASLSELPKADDFKDFLILSKDYDDVQLTLRESFDVTLGEADVLNNVDQA